jgi:hypothetical protein
MRRLGPTVLALGGLWFVPDGRAQDAEPPPAPDLDFLEYLGAWAAEDDEWLAIEEWQKDNGTRDGEKPDEDDGKQKSKGDEGE